MLMGWPPRIQSEQVNVLVLDLWEAIEKRVCTNDEIICALEIVKTRISSSEAMCVQKDSER